MPFANTALSEQAALVTGASRGIGRAVAEALARGGAKVLLTARDRAKLDAVADAIRRDGGKAETFPCDLADEDAPQKLVAAALAAFGKLTILVNNAGFGVYGPIEAATAADWDAMFRVNARAPFFLSRESLGPMRAAGGGAIVNIASVVGVKGYAGQGIYGASKHAMMGWSKALAVECQKSKVRVHTICPGGVDTDLVREARPDLDPSILIQPAAIAEAVLFLLKLGGQAVVDDLHIRRASGEPWF